MKTCVLAAVAGGLCAGQVMAAVLAVGPGTTNNGSSSSPVTLFFNMTNLSSQPITVSAFDVVAIGVQGSDMAIELYTHAQGTWVGNNADSNYWSLLSPSPSTAVSNGPAALTFFDTPDFVIDPGTTTAIALRSIFYNGGGGLRYNGTNTITPTLTFADLALQIDGGASETNGSFGMGQVRTNRMFAGAVHYSVAPAPAAAWLFGITGLAAARRRR